MGKFIIRIMEGIIAGLLIEGGKVIIKDDPQPTPSSPPDEPEDNPEKDDYPDGPVIVTATMMSQMRGNLMNKSKKLFDNDRELNSLINRYKNTITSKEPIDSPFNRDGRRFIGELIPFLCAYSIIFCW